MTYQNDDMIPDQGQAPFIAPKDSDRANTLPVRDRKTAAAMQQCQASGASDCSIRENICSSAG